MESVEIEARSPRSGGTGSSGEVAAALVVLARASARAQDIDLRHDRITLEALDCLEELAGSRIAAVGVFRAALAIPHPVTRRRMVGDAYKELVAFIEAVKDED